MTSTKQSRWRKIWQAIQHYWQTTDRWLLLLCLFMSAASVLFLYSIAKAGFQVSNMSRVYVQVGAVLLGFLSCLILSIINYQSLKKLWKIYVPLVVLLVVFTFLWGIEKGVGNKAWLLISIGSRTLSVQPAELLKISFITTFAMHLTAVRERINKPLTLLLLFLHGGAHIGLIAAQGDDGTAIIFGAIFIIMLFMAGLSLWYIVPGLGAVVLAAPLLWKFLLSDYQRDRFRVLWDSTAAPDISYQQDWGLTALGVGGTQGVGLFAEKHVYVPEMYNDFIFTYIGETLGFIGCFAVLVILLVICFKILYNSSLAGDMMGRLLCIGVFANIFSQTVINVGMNLKIMPTIGVTLPFLSSGGTSVLSLYLGIGLVISVYRHNTNSFFTRKT